MHNPPKTKASDSLRLNEDEIYIKIVRLAVVRSSIPDRDRILGLLRARRFDLLLDWSERPSPQMYDSASMYWEEAQIAQLIKKYPFPERLLSGLTPLENAKRKFDAAEWRCRRVNQRWRLLRKHALRGRWDPYGSFWHSARQYILNVIGPSPDLEEIYSNCDVTPGAAIGVHGNATNLGRKLLSDWSCAPRASARVIPALWSNYHIREFILREDDHDLVCFDKQAFGDKIRERVEHVDYNKIDFVPKTAKIHRTIAVEPFFNSYIQNGVDKTLRYALKRRASIDLSDQRLNTILSRIGSTGGLKGVSLPESDHRHLRKKFRTASYDYNWATVDLSSASDSIAIETVRELLPPDWFEYLNDIRSHNYMYNSEVKTYEKFCSMGNGFCFPLESLLFAALCHATLVECGLPPYAFNVYGDDIVIPREAALLLYEVLGRAGFTANKEKSFVVGPFRESCGADWYEGVNVRPCTLDGPIRTVMDAHAFHNTTWRNEFTEFLFEEARDFLRGQARNLYLRPGREAGDTAFSVPLDVAIPHKTVWWSRTKQQWSWLEYQPRAVKDRLPRSVSKRDREWLWWIAFLRGADSQNPLTLRYTEKRKTKRVCKQFVDTYVHPTWDTEESVSRELEMLCILKLR